MFAPDLECEEEGLDVAEHLLLEVRAIRGEPDGRLAHEIESGSNQTRWFLQLQCGHTPKMNWLVGR